MSNWNTLASEESLNKTVEALKNTGVEAFVVENGAAAKQKVLEMVPKKAEVMTMTSVTLDTIGLTDELNESGNYDSIKAKLMTMNRETQNSEMQKLGAGPDWTVGSVHAVTEDGKVVVFSNTGSQLAAYVYGAQHVIWVVGTQKIVANLDAAMQRGEEYVLPLESERAKKAYGMERSNISKVFILNKEVQPDRIKIIFVKESLGF